MKTLKQYAVISTDLKGEFLTLIEVSQWDLFTEEGRKDIEQMMIGKHKSNDELVKVLWRDF